MRKVWFEEAWADYLYWQIQGQENSQAGVTPSFLFTKNHVERLRES